MTMSFSMREWSKRRQWSVLLLLSLALIILLELLRVPAALLLGAMAAAIFVAAYEGKIAVPAVPYTLAQGLIACLIARAVNPDILSAMIAQWPVFLFSVVSVIACSTGLGGLLARWKVLPGTTAVWGSAPGAATVMVLMAEAYGADGRLVAFMQFLRVVLVALTASIVARLSGLHAGPVSSPDWLAPVDPIRLAATLLLAVAGSLIGARIKIPAGALLVPMFVGIALSATRALTVVLPLPLMACCYTLIGWAIGLRFTRDALNYAAHALPRVLATIFSLIVLCGGLACVLHWLTGVDALTAYLATSPGGADSVAVIAAASKVDMPFVMAMQMARFLLVMAIGPAMARTVARWATKTGGNKDG
ncbi:MAG: AbrB family transcriptional regulator [Burkholderiaceae bacterium]|nr:AbrB family transcriptional regulator [Burkholderiaceae bacterium]